MAHESLSAGSIPCDLPGTRHKALRLDEAALTIIADIGAR